MTIIVCDCNVLYYREMTNTELLLQHLSPEVAEKVIITMQKAIEGVTRSFHIQKLYSTGTTCNIIILFSYTKGIRLSGDAYSLLHAGILATVLQEGTASNPTSEAVNAAIAIIENFSGIFLPGLTDIMHPTLRLGLHAGKIKRVINSHNNFYFGHILH